MTKKEEAVGDRITVTMVEEGGTTRVLEDVLVGQTLMEAARAAGVEGILADCGGGCACATCHVYVDEDWREKVGPPDEIEAEMLDMVSDLARDNSRLSCQVRLMPELDGLSVKVAPPF